MEVLGNCGRSGREYGPDRNPVALRGRLASEFEPKVYPENRCRQCEIDGVLESEHCFHDHWEENSPPERSPQRAQHN